MTLDSTDIRAVALVLGFFAILFLVERAERKRTERRERLREAFTALADVLAEERSA